MQTGNTAGRWETVYNAIDFTKYDLKEQLSNDAPLMFLGRIEALKGTHIAVQVALKTQSKLWIAGNIEAEHRAFYEEQVAPFVDGEQIIYLGTLNDEQKNFYLGKSKALLFPIEWDEPFGMVMVEAMACGTPVIAFPGGAVREVVEEEKTGFIVTDENAMIEKVKVLSLIDRRSCRTIAQKRFDSPGIAVNYLNLFSYD